MTGFRTRIGQGILMGAGAALVYSVVRGSSGAREKRVLAESPSSSPLIDWRLATLIAERTSGDSLILHPTLVQHLENEYREIAREIEGPLRAYTGDPLSLADTEIRVMDRPAWVRANMRTFRDLLVPLEKLYTEGLVHPSGGEVLGLASQQAARLVLSGEMGILVGYLSRRVLGQYEIGLLSGEPREHGVLYFVETNMRRVESVLGVPRDDFRRWIAVHEATHAIEFERHPWVREYMQTTLRSYLQLLTNDLRRTSGASQLLAVPRRFIENIRRGHTFINAFMSPEQRELVSRMQCLMSLAEGYANHVMNAVGREILPHFQQVHERLERRQRNRSPIEAFILRVTGLSMKMEQYRLGEQFVDAIVRERGIFYANQAWNGPEFLPTDTELNNPARWIARIDQMVA